MAEERRATLPIWSPRSWHGMTAGVWFPFLWNNRFAASPSFWGLGCSVSLASCVNSALWLLSEAVYRRRAEAVVIDEPPVFVIGHWRTGTTWLHELLVQDERFTFPTTYQCMAPRHFLLTDRRLSGLMDKLLPRRRPMDNMLVGAALPQEDEFALMNMGAGSPYLAWAFANRRRPYLEYLTLQQLDNDGRARWKRRCLWFAKRLTLNNPKQLVLKSPGHTARIATLLEIFPEARFIHIVRNPLAFIPSTIRTWTRMTDALSLQVRRAPISEDDIFTAYEAMYAQFGQDRPLLADDRFCELRYEDLVANPLSEVQKVYQQLDLGDFAPARPAMERYLATIAGYQPNPIKVNDRLKERIQKCCAAYFERYGYA